MKRFLSLKWINNYLAAAVIALALYIFVLPFLPTATWWIKHDAPIVGAKPVTTLDKQEPVPSSNTLVIPKLDMRTEVFEGSSISTLNKGVWHMPGTSSPDKIGNTVMAGHRFTYDGKAVFYYLDKLSVSDNIYMYWQGKRYDYVISAVNVVKPEDTSLVAPTNDATLTIYTCTPVWSAKDRLVITAKLTEAH